MDSSEIPQALWQRAVDLVQKQGMPLNASSIQGAMNLLAAGGDTMSADNSIASVPTPGGADPLGSFMNRTDRAVTSAPLDEESSEPASERARETQIGEEPTNQSAGVNGFLPPTRGGAAKSAASGSSKVPGEQGPASLNSQDAMSANAVDGSKIANSTNDASSAPGTQDYFDPGGIGDIGGDNIGTGALAGGTGIAALLATLLGRGKSGPASSNAVGNARAGQLALPAPSSGPTMPMGGPEGWFPQSSNPGMRDTGIPGMKMPASNIRGSGRAGGGIGSNRGRNPKLGLGGALNTEIERLLQ